ncbi:MAG: HIT domain-containing protein [Caldiserica bacterium]|nr:HIT domain-containing protein [Caldisericota bacterium]
MKLLWAPWRTKYVSNPDGEGCFLCQALQEKDGIKNFILYRGKYSFIIMNLFPYNSGHLMVAPLRHEGDFLKIREEELQEMMHLSQLSIKSLKGAYHPHAFNLGMNLGKAAGAGLVDHLHIHVLPRWEGDTNFLPVFSETKVIPEDIKESYLKIRKHLEILLKNPEK